MSGLTGDTGPDGSGGACSGAESFALRVLGADMEPEFRDGDIVIVEPDGALKDGSFVLADLGARGWVLRQLARRGDARWVLRALNPAAAPPACAEIVLDDLAAVRGVIIHKAVPGRRRLSRFYV
jgi:SOS-response transcriptional repressor LexA